MSDFKITLGYFEIRPLGMGFISVWHHNPKLKASREQQLKHNKTITGFEEIQRHEALCECHQLVVSTPKKRKSLLGFLKSILNFYKLVSTISLKPFENGRNGRI